MDDVCVSHVVSCSVRRWENPECHGEGREYVSTARCVVTKGGTQTDSGIASDFLGSGSGREGAKF